MSTDTFVCQFRKRSFGTTELEIGFAPRFLHRAIHEDPPWINYTLLILE